jgi:exopolysaccharide biosynthesis polyprenyl glycosylphosphotransferase
MIRRYAYWLRALLMLVDGLLAVALLVVLSVLRFGEDWAVWWRLVVPEPLAFLALYAGGWVAVLAFHGLYRPRARWSIRSEAGDLARATLVMALLSLAVLFFFKVPDVSRLFLLILFPTQFVLALGTRAALRLGFRWLRERGYNTRFVVIVGAGARGQAFARRLAEHRELGLNVLGYVDDDPTFALPAGASLLGRLEDLPTILHERVVDEVAICLPFSQWNLVDAIARISEEEGKIVRVPMDVLDHAFATGKIEDLDGIPVFSLVSGPDRSLALAVKRTVDVVSAVAGLVLLSPLAGAVAIMIKREDAGPVLFRQRRVGLHGRPFEVVKFRSMVPDAEEHREGLQAHNELNGPVFKVTADPRITRTGRWLRRYSIDELPQLWNVLRGEMSLVGPRPPLPAEVAAYDVWHRRRLSMKPGMTGLWQVRARREPEFDRWVTADLEYIDRWSLWLDVKILARTIPAALEGR